jgi:DNA-binding beta-propeller fold protein YncE
VTVIDPATGATVRSWGRQGTGEGEVDLTTDDGNPGIGDIDVAPDGTVYVADGANHRLQAFEPDGTFVRQLGSFGEEPGQFSRPFLIATDAESSVYAVDHDLHTLTKFDRAGAMAWSISGPDPGMAVTARADGSIAWMGDFAPVLILDPVTGAVVDEWGETGRRSGQLEANCDIAVDGAGNEYVFGCFPSRTQVFDADHRLLGGAYEPRDQVLIPTFGPGETAYGLTADRFASDDIYVLDLSLPASPTASGQDAD